MSGRRAAPTGERQSSHIVGRAGKDRLDAAVRTIANPTVQPALSRLLNHPSAKPNALDTAFDNQPKTDPRAHGSREFDDLLIDGQALARAGMQLTDLAVAFGSEDVFHLHRLDHSQHLTGLDLLTFGNGKRYQ